MSKTERREVHTTREVRTFSPSQRTLSNQNLTEFDNNLGNLLEDLQSSVSRPSSSLGNAYRESRTTTTYGSGTGKTDSLGRVHHLSAANPTTVIADDAAYSFKPGETVKSVKIIKEDYGSYNVKRAVSPEKVRMQTNINKLDSLLDDLQQARHGTLDRGISDAGIDPGLLESSTGTGSKHVTSKKTVHRELVYDKESAQRNRRAGSVEREILVNDGTYGDIRPIRHQSPSRSGTLQSSKVYNYSTESNSVAPGPEILESTNPDINPNILAQLDPTLLPPPNTKVTTTIKTYTYEIPGSGYPSAVSPKLSETVFSSNPSTPSQSFAYNKIENTSSSNLSPSYTGGYIRPVSPNPSGYNKQIDTTTTTRNISSDGYPKLGFESPSLAKKTYIHNETHTRNVINDPKIGYEPLAPGNKTYIHNETTTRNVNQPEYPRSPRPVEKQVHIYNKTTTTNVNQPQNGYPSNRYPPEHRPTSPGSTHHTYIVNETNTTRNHSRNGYPPNQSEPVISYPTNQGYPPGHTTVIYKHDTHTTHNNIGNPNQPYNESFDPNNLPPYGGKPNQDPRDPNNLNITYKYSSNHTSSNNYRGHPNDESEPLLQPRPFPTGPGNEIDGPPKKLDQLLAEIGHEPPNNSFNAGYNAKQAEIAQKKEVEKLSSDLTQKKVDVKDLPKTKNVAGPAVYYPPGHEMFSHKEESGGYSAQGGMMRESGKYKYEAKSSSKSKSSSGMAVVPVCLPLCCGLPCVIM